MFFCHGNQLQPYEITLKPIRGQSDGINKFCILVLRSLKENLTKSYDDLEIHRGVILFPLRINKKC